MRSPFSSIPEMISSPFPTLPSKINPSGLFVNQSSITVDASATAQPPVGAFIMYIKDAVAEKVPVETGQSRGVLIQINGPVKEGDLLVIQGQTYLQKGTIVKVVDTKEYLPKSTEF